jgi:PIN domain nuclease of toxin-antitoxin system
MRILLDTHIFCWWFYEPKKLSATTLEIMREADRVFVSSASIWEVAIKARLGKMNVDPEELFHQIQVNGFHELPVLSKHALIVAGLPLHHSDPFDRLLIAQAICEPLRLMTTDSRLSKYTDLVIEV